MKRLLVLLVVVLSLTGCWLRTINRQQLNEVITKMRPEVSSARAAYRGSKNGYHYLIVWYNLFPGYRYRIRQEELLIDSPFPFTTDESRWTGLFSAAPELLEMYDAHWKLKATSEEK